MNIVEYTEFLIKSVAVEKDMVSVKEIGSTDDLINLEVLIKESDMGKVIGKNGKTSMAIRTLVQAYSYLHDKKRIKINIEAF